MAGNRARRTSAVDDRERLLRLLRLTASDRDGEALAALRRAAQQMERLGLDWDGLVRGPAPTAPSLEALAEAVAVGRAAGRREGRAEAERARERAFAEGFAAGRALARAEAADATEAGGLRVVDLGRRRGAAREGRDADDEDRALITAVLDNPHAPPRTTAFVADLHFWLDTRGRLTPAQREALHRTHQRWGLGAA